MRWLVVAVVGWTGVAHADPAADAFAELTRADHPTIAQLRGYIDRFGAAGGPDRLAVASGMLGDLYWHASCPVPEHDGECVRAVPPPPPSKLPVTCGGRRATYLGVKRNVRLRAAAIDAYRAAARAADAPGDHTGDDALAAGHYRWRGRLAELELGYEDELLVAMPGSLDFDPADQARMAASLRELDRWTRARRGAASAAMDAYRKLLDADPETAIAASERIARIDETFGTMFSAAAIPPSLRAGPYAQDKVDAYCDAMTAVGEPLLESAERSYESCVERVSRFEVASAEADRCVRALARLAPETFPLQNERVGDPRVTPAMIAEPPP
ncbi:MAG TPA: hypothetical protein VLX92_00750 [Kofleriaceae bacterium]|nr:hypothetical protein [Kofleriaceae bacterium]